MARVLLIQPPLTAKELWARGSKLSASLLPPLGLAYIAALLREKGHECAIIDGIADPVSLDTLSRTARRFDVVGVTAVSTYALRAMQIIGKLKEKPGCPPIVVGGPHVTVLPEALLGSGADYAVVGEGEFAMLELVEALAGGACGHRIHAIPGIGYLQNGSFVCTPRRERIDPLDQIPLPARDLLPMDKYTSSIARDELQPSHSMLTSRGCPGVCSFCSKKTFGTKVRYFSTERILEEFFLLRDRYGARSVAVWDDNFLADVAVVRSVCDGLMSRGFGRPFSVEARVDAVDMDILHTLKRAGCARIAYGIESGSQRILDHMHKRISKERMREVIRWTREVGIPVRGYFMMGFPGETRADIEETIRFAVELDLDLVSFTLLVPLPGTVEFRRAQESGTFDPEYFNKRIIPEFNFLDSPVYVPEGFTAEGLLALHRAAYRRYYFRPQILWRRLSKLRSFDDVKILLGGGYTLIANLFRVR